MDTLDSSTNKIERHDITEMLLKVAFNTISLILWGRHFPLLAERW